MVGTLSVSPTCPLNTAISACTILVQMNPWGSVHDTITHRAVAPWVIFLILHEVVMVVVFGEYANYILKDGWKCEYEVIILCKKRFDVSNPEGGG